MIHFWKILIAVAAVVAASGSPLFCDILEIPKNFYGFAGGINAGHYFESLFLQAYTEATHMSQRLSFQTFALSLAFAYGAARLCRILFSPLDYKCELPDAGYLTNDRLSKRETANQVRKRRKIEDIPPVYPNGWFIAIRSAELPVKVVKYVHILGEHLAVFRGEDGVAYILDAYCPHLGANIAVGGLVEGNCIKCPFHGWRFQGDSGACVEIPYSRGVPEFAKTRSWITIERNNRVYVWYHAEEADPDWFPEEIEEIRTGAWSYCGQTVHHINCHIEDLPENGGDINHLKELHTPLFSSGKNLNKIFTSLWNFLGYHEWIALWEPLEGNEKHCGIMTLMQKAYLFGYHLPIFDTLVKAKQIGPGIVYMRWSTRFGQGVITHEVTPVEPLLQKLTQTSYTGFPTPKLLGKIILILETIQLERDVMVWNYKSYLSKPMLVKEDVGIKKHRKWYKQFYSENSPRLSLAKNNNMEW